VEPGHPLDDEADDTEGRGDLPTVLVIDDDPPVHQLMERFLERQGFAVKTFKGGSDVLEKVRRIQPDIITLDVLMPKIDGWSILDSLKADDELQHIPVVMLTIINDRNMGFSLGATDYLLKPVEPLRLTRVLSSHLNGEESGPVLIVEDDEDTREILRRMVEQAGWETAVAADGQEALQMLDDKLDPSAILLDLMMPRLDGFGVLQALRERPGCQEIAVIVVSAAELTPEEQQMLQGSVAKVLKKGDEAQAQLVSELRGILHRRATSSREEPATMVSGDR
jgi:CheY-like chemotaxis protein